MSQLSALRVPIRRRLGDPGSVRWTDDVIVDFWFNRSATHTGAVTRCLSREFNVDLAADTQEYTIVAAGGNVGDDAAFFSIRSVKLTLTATYKRDLIYRPLYGSGAETWTTGEPRYWHARRLKGLLTIQVYPIPSAAYVAVVNGYYTPWLITANQYTQLPAHMENVPGHLVQSMMEAGNQDYENATLSYQKYRAELLKSQMAMARS